MSFKTNESSKLEVKPKEISGVKLQEISGDAHLLPGSSVDAELKKIYTPDKKSQVRIISLSQLTDLIKTENLKTKDGDLVIFDEKFKQLIQEVDRVMVQQ